eukprot:TRINITY_DN102199_c0_g1_i1.p1 TRINITY_DN102199_c0_g1~~TRINITY_DN102199_c0_g1_i1.p1  ORF type:complete len:663 (-),score=105.19 TRINITY_DN102199_c0_g1_i1:409-2397(-)
MNVDKQQIKQIVDGLSGPGFCVIDGFLGRPDCQTLRSRLESCHRRGELKPGRVGPSAAITREQSLRTDVAMAVGPGWDPLVDDLICRLGGMITAAASDLPELAGPLAPAAVQCAAYPGRGTFYARHVDNPGSDMDDRRRLTTVYYCNPEWKASQGGALRVHWADGSSCAGQSALRGAASSLGLGMDVVARRLGVTKDIEPIGDRLVVFWADYRMPHEVLPSSGMRFAVSTWWADPGRPGDGTRNKLYAQHCAPQRLALKRNEFRPEFLASGKEAANNVESGRPSRLRALFSHGICQLSQYFGPEATLKPEDLRSGVRALGSNAVLGTRRLLASGSSNLPRQAAPLVAEFLEILDKFVYVVGSSAPDRSGFRALITGGRTQPFLTTLSPAEGPVLRVYKAPSSMVHAVFFLWGLPGWKLYAPDETGKKGDALTVTAGDLWLLPTLSDKSSACQPHLLLEMVRNDEDSPTSQPPAPRWLEVWLFGDSLLQSDGQGETEQQRSAKTATLIADIESQYEAGLSRDSTAAVSRFDDAGTDDAAVARSTTAAPSGGYVRSECGKAEEAQPASHTDAGCAEARASVPYYFEPDLAIGVAEEGVHLAFQLGSLLSSLDASAVDLQASETCIKLTVPGRDTVAVTLPKPAAAEAPRISRKKQELRVRLKWT